MTKNYDTIIVGAGIMGAATAHALSQRGNRLLLIDRFTPPHDRGSSHGETRVIREAYFEDPLYVPLVQHAYKLWRELETQSGEELLKITGGLMIGPPDGVVFSGARQSAEEHRLPHEILDAESVNREFPAFRVPGRFSAVYEPGAGMLYAERCHETLLRLAASSGAHLLWNAPVHHWTSTGEHVSVQTPEGTFEARQLVFATGAWMNSWLKFPKPVLSVERQVLHWFHPDESEGDCSPDAFPVHVWEYESGKYFYALPDAGSGVKAALHHQGVHTSPDTMQREVDAGEKTHMHSLVQRHLPPLTRPPHQSVVCLYTNTADGHFLIDHHPEYGNVILLSPCSGHGFKFAPTIGEIAADLATRRKPRFDISLFRLNRF